MMSFSIKCRRIPRMCTTIRSYCDNKSSYQRHEEGLKPRLVHGKEYPEWRKRWIQREGEWTSKLHVFVEKNPNPDLMNALSKAPELTIQKIKDWWAQMKVVQQIQNQKFLPERVAALGSNLAAVHFFSYRGALVKLRDSKEWIKGDIISLKLPDHYVEGFFVEAVDCTNFHHNGIRYEGIQNLSNLNFLKWLSLRNNRHVDVWCLDRLAGQNGQTLEYLDIRGCQFSLGCINAIARMTALKVLVMTDPGDDMELQAGLSILEKENPNLIIKTVSEEDVE